MFINAKQVKADSSFKTAVCIIGGGIAGISIAVELNRKGVECCIIESGSFRSEYETMDLYRGESDGIPYNFADGCRSRYLGGSSNCWGGWCGPMDTFDLEKRSWVNNSGWPIDWNELERYYERAHHLLQLGPYNYNPDYWETAINRSDVKRFQFNNDTIRDMVSQFSPPARFGKLYHDELKHSKQITVFLNCNVTNIKTDETGENVIAVEAKTLEGNNHIFYADHFVLATGGIENARLLLLSNDVQKRGLGNDNDLVGRYFMDHPRLLIGSVRFADKWKHNRLYDMKYNYHHRFVAANGTCIAGQLALSRKVQEEEGILNGRICFFSFFPGENSNAVSALLRYKQAITKKNKHDFKAIKDLFSILTNPFDVSSYVATRFVRPRFLITDTKIQVLIEQQPDFDNRVSLSKEIDSLGSNRVKVTWKPGEMEKRTFDKTLQVLATQLKQHKLVEKIDIGEKLENAEWPSSLQGTWHHMGTTRMHQSPKHGVVDSNCKVYGISNLFVAGSSVFTTSGPNFPTITLTALAARLSDHLSLLCRKKPELINSGTNSK